MFHFICFSFSPFPDLMCYVIQKTIQMGKTLALKQEAGGRKKEAQRTPLLTSPSPWGEIVPPRSVPHKPSRWCCGVLPEAEGTPSWPWASEPAPFTSSSPSHMWRKPNWARNPLSALSLNLRTFHDVTLTVLQNFLSQFSVCQLDSVDGDAERQRWSGSLPYCFLLQLSPFAE